MLARISLTSKVVLVLIAVAFVISMASSSPMQHVTRQLPRLSAQHSSGNHSRSALHAAASDASNVPRHHDDTHEHAGLKAYAKFHASHRLDPTTPSITFAVGTADMGFVDRMHALNSLLLLAHHLNRTLFVHTFLDGKPEEDRVLRQELLVPNHINTTVPSWLQDMLDRKDKLEPAPFLRKVPEPDCEPWALQLIDHVVSQPHSYVVLNGSPGRVKLNLAKFMPQLRVNGSVEATCPRSTKSSNSMVVTCFRPKMPVFRLKQIAEEITLSPLTQHCLDGQCAGVSFKYLFKPAPALRATLDLADSFVAAILSRQRARQGVAAASAPGFTAVFIRAGGSVLSHGNSTSNSPLLRYQDGYNRTQVLNTLFNLLLDMTNCTERPIFVASDSSQIKYLLQHESHFASVYSCCTEPAHIGRDLPGASALWHQTFFDLQVASQADRVLGLIGGFFIAAASWQSLHEPVPVMRFTPRTTDVQLSDFVCGLNIEDSSGPSRDT